MAFNFFKKKKLDYDPTNMQITDLKKGFLVEYDLKTWEVTREYQYDWGDNFFTREVQLRCHDEIRYLHFEVDDELVLTLTRKIGVPELSPDVISHVAEKEVPPKTLEFEGRTYRRQSENPGYFQEAGKKDWQEFISWDYKGKDGEVLSVEQWGEESFDAGAGKIVQDYEFSNILPGEAK